MKNQFPIMLLFLAGLAFIVLRRPAANISTSVGNVSSGSLPLNAPPSLSSSALDAFVSDLADRSPDLFPDTAAYLANHPVQNQTPSGPPGLGRLVSEGSWGIGQLLGI